MDAIKQHARAHVKTLTARTTELVGEVIVKGMMGVLEECIAMSIRIQELEEALAAHPAPSSDAAMFWYVAMPDGSHDGGVPYLSEEDAQDYVDKRAIPGCSVRPLFAAHPANGAQGGEDWLGRALELEAQASRAQSQTAQRAMEGAAHCLRLMGKRQQANGAQAGDALNAIEPDAVLLDFLDNNLKLTMGWRVGIAPAGNVSVQSIIACKTTIREAIHAAIATKHAATLAAAPQKKEG